MFRGYVDPTVYYSGLGTENFAAYLAERGFVTVAPDFLGYAESDPPGEIPLQDRFQTYTTALDLLASVKNLNPALQSLEEEEKIKVTVDDKKIGIWGHSNGGHISLSTLAITGKDYPTILWNPVSKHFPYSIMFYMDEFEDQGKYLRGIVADFEEEYDIDKYSAPNYYEWINAPIQLHQGSADDILPQKWSDQLDKVLQEEDVEIEYIVHPGADHNLSGGTGWSDAARAGVEFYNQYFDQL
jgi:dienelactone hydrolase